MRQPVARFLVLLFVALVGMSASSRAFADARAEAKAHYQAGVKAYGAGDYRSAIKEFSAAQQLAPADLNNYNLALCYDKLGEAEPAIQYYKEYLAKVPNADKRVEIEASISRLEGALKSAATKRAEEARRAEEAKKAEAKNAEEAKTSAAASGAASGAGAAAGAEPTKGTGATAAGTDTTPEVPETPPAVGVGSTGTPGTGQAVSTGDAQLDRVAAIDINAIRDQRFGASGGGAAAAPSGGGAQGAAGPDPRGAGASPDATAPTDQPKKPTPIYKKWWFWAVVAVSAFVVYQIATEDSRAPTRSREATAPTTRSASESGMTLFRF